MSTFPAPERAQIFFHVRDMISRHAADIVERAVLELDARATVSFDLPMRRVEIRPTRAEPSDFKNAITGAGYSSVRQWPLESAYF